MLFNVVIVLGLFAGCVLSTPSLYPQYPTPSPPTQSVTNEGSASVNSDFDEWVYQNPFVCNQMYCLDTTACRNCSFDEEHFRSCAPVPQVPKFFMTNILQSGECIGTWNIASCCNKKAPLLTPDKQQDEKEGLIFETFYVSSPNEGTDNNREEPDNMIDYDSSDEELPTTEIIDKHDAAHPQTIKIVFREKEHKN